MIVMMAVAGGLGAALRFLVGVWLQGKGDYPWGTLAVNLSGSLLLGFLVGLGAGSPWMSVLTTGFCGGYTTFSAASLETLELLRKNRPGLAAASGILQLMVALGAAAVGVAAGMSLG